MDDTRAARLLVPVSERDHVQGPADAPVTLVEYGDFECPYCRAAVPIVRGVQEALGDRLRFVWRNFPLRNQHPHAMHAAEAAEAAGAQGRFFDMHGMLFDRQEDLTDDDLVGYAGELGLDTDRFRRELESHEHAGRVRADFEGGLRSGVRGTPTFYIDGVRYDGLAGVRQLLEAIREAHPDAVDEEATAAASARAIPRVVKERTPYRERPG
jgi:protein-disulfide isomerase